MPHPNDDVDAGGSNPEADAAPGDADPIVPGEDRTLTVSSGGLERTYILHVPERLREPAMLVLAFHGFGMPLAVVGGYSGLSALSDEKGFLAAYPAGQNAACNGGLCCPGAAPDDVQFTRDMVAAISESFSVDSKRIFATGLSNGALFSNRLGCEASDLFAAIAPIAGGVGVACEPPRPVPHMAFWGTADPFVPQTTIDGEMNQWRGLNGCAAEPQQTFANGDATCVSWAPCTGGADTVLCTLEGGGHTWPGSKVDIAFLGPTSKSIDASREMLAFFEKHPMP